MKELLALVKFCEILQKFSSPGADFCAGLNASNNSIGVVLSQKTEEVNKLYHMQVELSVRQSADTVNNERATGIS